MTRVSRVLDRVSVVFEDPNLAANAGLIPVSTLVTRGPHMEKELSGKFADLLLWGRSPT